MTKKNRDYIWNAIAGLINASEAIILSVVVSRTAGIVAAGVLSIAFATGNVLRNVGMFGTRVFQVTDVKREFSFPEYRNLHILSGTIMTAMACVYVLYGYLCRGYSFDKIICILGICFIYVIESFEDAYLGHYQLKGRLDVSSKVFTLRWIVILLVSSIALVIGAGLATALMVALFASLIVECLSILSVRRFILECRYDNDCSHISFVNPKLFLSCLPLTIMGFLSFYVINSPKYAIDAVLNDSVQACYGYVAMPVFVIGLLNGFIYTPILVKMAIDYQEKKYYAVWKRIYRQLFIIAGITVICEAGAYIFGIPVLSWLYNTDLSDYKAELLIMLLGGGMLAVSGFFSTVLTMIRKKKEQLYAYVAAAVIALLASNMVVRQYGTTGAAIMYFVLISMISAIYGTQIWVYLKREAIR